MSDKWLVEVVSYGYENFVLRDFLGKVLPGILTLAALVSHTDYSYKLLQQTQTLTTVQLLGVVGLAWLVGLALEAVPILLNFDTLWSNDAERESHYKRLLDLDKVPASHKKIFERMWVLSSATRNSAIAMFTVAISRLINFFLCIPAGNLDWSSLVLSLVIGLFGLLLFHYSNSLYKGARELLALMTPKQTTAP